MPDEIITTVANYCYFTLDYTDLFDAFDDMMADCSCLITRFICSVHLQLSQGVITLLLARGLLCAQRDQLVNAVSHCSKTKKRTKKNKCTLVLEGCSNNSCL